MLVILIVCLFSYLACRIAFRHKHYVKTLAQIERIQFQRIDDLWSPEVQVDYSFTLKNYEYLGSGYMCLDQLLGDTYFLLATRKGLPVLNSHEGQYISEEHIEHYLLSKKDAIMVKYNQDNPLENKIHYKGEVQNGRLFQNTKIDFPWTH